MKPLHGVHALLAFLVLGIVALAARVDPGADRFRQLDEILPTANAYRTASGAPGHEYWQQQADYTIEVTLDDERQHIRGHERITYHNRSPDALAYLWVQIDPNLFSPESHAVLTALSPSLENPSYRTFQRELARAAFDGGATITSVADGAGQPLHHAIVDTMMRVDLGESLESGSSTQLMIDWNYPINHSDQVRGRTGCEFFEEDGNYIYEIAQWFPRMAAYTDATGWQHKQYLGRGEFTLEFGDYEVHITVPEDHVVAATGVLQNPADVLSADQRARLEQARTAERPVFIITPEEAETNEASRATGTRTWTFAAENVRDFAFASSRKFIWDARGHRGAGHEAMAMSFYPKEGEPLWSRYSTQAILHTLEVYSRHTFPYPYPVAISVNGPVGGMEYPMICFNGPRPEEDGTYSERSKYGLISVVIHEVGHNWFPMVVNSDERQWTWMDEGLNTFLQFLAEQAWEDDYPSRRGEAENIVPFMTSAEQVPIMTNSESLLQFGSNAYAKPATALNLLRETVLGRELFDFAFQEYSRRWRFRRPQPADFFRTMEDATAVDLDWFFRGWFYTTDHVDIAIEGLRHYTIDTQDPEVEKALARQQAEERPMTLTALRNADLPKRTDRFPELLDFYNDHDELDVTAADLREYAKFLEGLEDDAKEILQSNLHIYAVDFRNVGGLVSPLPLEIEYEDGEVELRRYPAEIWRRDGSEVSKLILCEKKIARLQLDPHRELADADVENNAFPRRPTENRIRIETDRPDRKNPMQKAREEERRAQEEREQEPEDGGETGGRDPAPSEP